MADAMTIHLAVFAYLSQYQPDGQSCRHARPIDVADGATVGELIARLGQRLVVGGVDAVHKHRAGSVRQSETGDQLAHGGAVSDIDGARVATALPVGLVLRKVCEKCQMDGHGISHSDPRAASTRSPARGSLWLMP